MTTDLVAPSALAQAARPLPIVLILDASWSIEVAGLRPDVHDFLRRLPSELEKRATLRNSAEVALITMNHEGVLLRTGDPTAAPYGFVRPSALITPSNLVCNGVTRLDEALRLAVGILERRCEQIAEAGRSFYRPYLAIVCDGAPTDAHGDRDEERWRVEAARTAGAIEGKLFVEAFLPAGVPAGVLPELVGGAERVRQFDARSLAAVVEAVSFSAERNASGTPSGLDRVRRDLTDAYDSPPAS